MTDERDQPTGRENDATQNPAQADMESGLGQRRQAQLAVITSRRPHRRATLALREQLDAFDPLND